MAEEASAPAPAPADPPAAQPPTDPAVTAPAVTAPDAAVVPGLDAAAFEAPPEVDPADLAAAGAALDQISIEELLKQASFEDPTAVGSVAAPDASELKLPNIQQVMQDAQVSSIELLRDVELNVKIELGRARMLVEDVLKLSEGSVVELDKLAGDPVDVFVNERLVARGEVLVLNDNFCVRVNEIVAGVREEGQ
jgi:flagellar motor switch protein FliN/FliY